MTRPALHVVAFAYALLVFMAAVAVFEHRAFGWHFAREVEPVFDYWHLVRLTVTGALCFALVAATVRSGLTPERIGKGALALAWAIMLASIGSAALLAVSPAAFATFGAEDSAIEWLSALLLFAAAAFMAFRFRQTWRSPATRQFRTLHLVLAAGFVGLFLLMGMEEVSWFQRQIGFATPAAVAERNWQGEFNLHNLQTDIAELLLYSATGLFLILLPLLRESQIARLPLLAPLAPFLPDRTVAAVSAPMVIFTYSHWTLLPVQATTWIALAVCVAFTLNSSTMRGRMLWSALAAWVALGQLLVLVIGDNMLMMFDSSEYRELFMSVGLAAYAFRQWTAPGRLTEA